MALDGVVEAPDQWPFPYFSDEMGVAVTAQTEGVDTMLFGRKTYDSFAGAWPERELAGGPEAEYARGLGEMRKIVASHQQLDFSWRNSEQLQGDLIEFVRDLKAADGGNIALSGSVSVVRQLLRAGLVDELHLLVHPIVVGHGLRMFDDGETIPLRLLSSDAFPTGVVYSIYAPDTAPPVGGYREAAQHLDRG